MNRPAHSFSGRGLAPIPFMIMVGVALSLAGYFVADGLTQTAERSRFNTEANFVFDHLEAKITTTFEILHSLSGLIVASDNVERREFRAFVDQLGPMPSVQALEWVPRVGRADRAGLEDAARRDGYPDFSFTERGPDGALIPAAERDEYFPVYYVEPHAGNEAAFGFDLASNPARLAALQQARDSGDPVATARITLVQETGEQYGFLVFRPVYHRKSAPDTPATHRDDLAGFTLGVFHIGDLVANAGTGASAADVKVDIEIFDRSAPVDRQRLYPKTARADRTEPDPDGLYATRDLIVGGRNWSITATPLPAFAATAAFAWQGWAVFLTGLTFTGLAIMFYYHMHYRATVIGETVEERTAQLRDSEARSQAVIATAVDAVITIDSAGIVETFNPAAELIFGYEAADCIGRNIKMLMPEPYHSAHDGYLSNYLGTGDAKIIGIGREVVGRRKSGETFAMDLSVSEFAIGGKRMFAGICRDVTERNRARRELEESQEILRALADNVPDFISLKDPDGRFRFINKRFEEWVGLDRRDVIGKTVHDIYPVEQAIEFEAQDRKSIDERIINSREIDLHYPDGNIRTVISTRFPVISAGGDMLGLGTVNFDITEQKRVREEITAVNKELESFAYSVSHDLRAPLRAIDGFSQALIEDHGDQLEGEARAYLGRIRSGAQRMGQLIDDMLSLSRVTRREMTRKPVDLSQLAEDVARELREADPGRDVAVTISPGLHVHGDKRLLRILLKNLIGNAWKFTSANAEPRIDVGIATKNGISEIFVSDNGAGFDMAYTDKLFVPFQRLHSVKEFEGTGVGLATVARIIQRHGGSVRAEGAVGQGATLYFTVNG